MKTPFEILEIPHGSSIDEAKKAFRRLALIYHPDKSGGNMARFTEISRAYEDIQKGNFGSSGGYNPRPGRTQYRYTAPEGFYDEAFSGNFQDIINEFWEKQQKRNEGNWDFSGFNIRPKSPPRKMSYAEYLAEQMAKKKQAEMNKQFNESHEEWKKRMRDNITNINPDDEEKSNFHNPYFRGY